MTAHAAPPRTDALLLDVIDARAHCPTRVPGRLIIDDDAVLHVLLMEPAPTILVGSRLVLRGPQRRMSGVVVDRTGPQIAVELLRVYRTEQRSWPRVTGDVRCLCRFDRSWTWPDRVVDVSVGGVAFITKSAARPGEPVTIMLSLPMGSGPWRLRGKVVRVDLDVAADRNRIAVEFVELPDAARARMMRYSADVLAAVSPALP